MNPRPLVYSHTRSTLLRECPRAYWLKYGCTGRRGQVARALSRLGSLPMVLGSVADLIVAHSIRRPDQKNLGGCGARLFRRVVADGELAARSAAESGVLPPRLPRPAAPLVHSYFNLDLGPEYLARLEDRLVDGLNRLETSELLARLRALPARKVFLPALDGIPPPVRIEGMEIIAVPDIVVSQHSIRVIDVKAGNPLWRESAMKQVRLYGLTEWLRRGIDADRIETQVLWLAEGEGGGPRPLTLEGVVAALEEAARWRAEFRDRLERACGEDPEAAYEARPSASRCTLCPFRFAELCAEGASATDHLPTGPRLPL